MSEQAKSKPTFTGRVASNKMDKTIVVVVTRKVPHPKYGKFVTRRTKIFAHDEENQCQIGDLVIIQACRPLSRHKNWMLVKVLEKAEQEA